MVGFDSRTLRYEIPHLPKETAMPRVQLTITINTDPVPGGFDNVDDFKRSLQADVDRFPESYGGRVHITPALPRTNCTSADDLIKVIGYDETMAFVEWADRKFFVKDGKRMYWSTDMADYLNHVKSAILSKGYDG
jgi:hypothetical protein